MKAKLMFISLVFFNVRRDFNIVCQVLGGNRVVGRKIMN